MSNGFERNRPLPQDSNADVDRAMAAFEALPMAYSNFPPASACEMRVSGEEPVGRQVRSELVVAFPLLIAALPGISQASMPAPPPGMDTTQGKPQPSASTIKQADQEARRAKSLDSSMAPLPQMTSPPGQTVRTPNLSSIFGLPPRQVPATQTAGRTAPAPRVADLRTTPIAAMFQALQPACPSHDQPPQTSSGLQEIFRRL